MRPLSLSAVWRCLRQPRHTPLIILPLNTLLISECVRICSSVHKWSTQDQWSTSEDQNEAGRGRENREEAAAQPHARVAQFMPNINTQTCKHMTEQG